MSESVVRILFVDHTAAMSGGEIALLNLVNHLDRKSYTPIVLLYSDGPLRPKLEAAGVETHVLPLDARVINIRKDSLSATGALRQAYRGAAIVSIALRTAAFIRRHRIDIVHANSLKADVIAGIAARLAGRPVIWHVRDRIDDDYLPRRAVRIFRWLSRTLPSAIIANSSATLQTLKLPYRNRVLTVHSGVQWRDHTRIVHDGAVRSDCARPGGPVASNFATLALIGRISRWKGQHVFLQAAHWVHQQFPHARFRIIGAALFAEREYEAELHRLVETLKLADVVEFTGFREDIDVAVREIDILVHASISGEPFGQVVIEGMAAGKPVVATAGGGVPEIIIDGATGILVPMGDAAAMANAMCRLLSDRNLAARMGRLGEQRVRDYFAIESTAHKVENFYATVLKRPPLLLRTMSSLMQLDATEADNHQRWRHRFFGISVLVALASVLAYLIHYNLGTSAPFAGPYLIVTAWIARRWGATPGYVATLTSFAIMMAVAFHYHNTIDVPRVAMFLLVGLTIIHFIGQLHYDRSSGIATTKSMEAKLKESYRRTGLLNSLMVSDSLGSACDTAAYFGASRLANWCVVDVMDTAGQVRKRSVSTSDPEQFAVARAMAEQGGGISEDAEAGLNESRMNSPSEIKTASAEAEQLPPHYRLRLEKLLRAVGVESFLIVPIKSDAGLIGAVSMGRSSHGRAFDSADMLVAEEIAWAVAMRAEQSQRAVESDRLAEISA